MIEKSSVKVRVAVPVRGGQVGHGQRLTRVRASARLRALSADEVVCLRLGTGKAQEAPRTGSLLAAWPQR